jgi:hypothetical protein
MPPPAHPKIYHIVHADRLRSIVDDDCLWSDSMLLANPKQGTVIGMTAIKERRLHLAISSRPGLHVGECVPFYFCPRSVMLYLIYRGNHPELTYRGGQGPIVHLECDFEAAVEWADRNNGRWAFTLSNAGAYYFEDRCNLAHLNEINWAAVAANDWSATTTKEGKQAEFLVEQTFPWRLVQRIGVQSQAIALRVAQILQYGAHRPTVQIKTDWYY